MLQPMASKVGEGRECSCIVRREGARLHTLPCFGATPRRRSSKSHQRITPTPVSLMDNVHKLVGIITGFGSIGARARGVIVITRAPVTTKIVAQLLARSGDAPGLVDWQARQLPMLSREPDRAPVDENIGEARAIEHFNDLLVMPQRTTPRPLKGRFSAELAIKFGKLEQIARSL